MKYVAGLVAFMFVVGGAFIPPPLHSEVGIKASAFDHTPSLNIALQTQAKAEYTISYYQDQVFKRESGWRLTATNEIGCIGLGQSCPASKLENACPNWRTDFDCQMSWFTAYMHRSYGSWENAWNHELQYGWW